MTHSALTNKIRLSSQSSSRRGARIDTFLIHHTASVSGRGDAIVNMMVNRTRQVSSNYVIGNDGYLWMVVDEDLRAWTSGSTKDGGKGAAWDRRSITVEIVNQKGAPSWAISSAAIDKAARLLNDLRKRYGIKHVLGHRDLWTRYKASYATYCPGPDTVGRVVKRADELLKPVVKPPAPPVVPAPPRLPWEGVAPVTMFTRGVAVVVDPLTGVERGRVAADTALAIASKVEVDGVTFFRTDWSTRNNNDSGIVSSSLRLTAKPEPVPEPPVVVVPEPPVVVEPEPPVVVVPEPPVVPETPTPSGRYGWLYAIVTAVTIAIAAIVSLF